MAMKINPMENKIGDYREQDDIDSSVYTTQAPKGKGKMPFYKSLAAGTALAFGLSLTPACYADNTTKEVTSVQAPAPKNTANKNEAPVPVTQISNQKVAQKGAQAGEAKASVMQKKDYLTLVILDFDGGSYRWSAYNDVADLTKSVPDLLTADLDGSDVVRVMDKVMFKGVLRKYGYTLDQFMENPAILSGKVKIDYLITGSYTLNSDEQQLTIVSKCIDYNTGLVSETQKVTGRVESLNSLVDRLGDEVEMDLGKYIKGNFHEKFFGRR